jgi:amidase
MTRSGRRRSSSKNSAPLMIKGHSMGTDWEGYYTTSLLDFYAHSWPQRANDLSETTKLVILLGQYMQNRYHDRCYAKAQNLARSLRAAYDQALQQVDVLVMPTLPMKATEIPSATASREEYVARALEMISNTCPCDVPGYPAMNVPCAMSNGLPIDLMLVGRHWQESTVLRAAHAFEQTVDWQRTEDRARRRPSRSRRAR